MRGDPRLLRRLIRNLLENAERYGKPPTHVGLRKAANGIVLEVSDAGAGIPEAERERVFAPFYRVPGSAAASGHGLGLALVRQIAELHGGGAMVVARPEGGTAFRVTLPA
jgi:signal transduction histidine kinase